MVLIYIDDSGHQFLTTNNGFEWELFSDRIEVIYVGFWIVSNENVRWNGERWVVIHENEENRPDYEGIRKRAKESFFKSILPIKRKDNGEVIETIEELKEILFKPLEKDD